MIGYYEPKWFRLVDLKETYIFQTDILGRGNALWMSDDDRHLVCASFDDRLVHSVQLTLYGGPGVIDSWNTTTRSIRYPKVRRQYLDSEP